jgi:hypothetical protein
VTVLKAFLIIIITDNLVDSSVKNLVSMMALVNEKETLILLYPTFPETALYPI